MLGEITSFTKALIDLFSELSGGQGKAKVLPLVGGILFVAGGLTLIAPKALLLPSIMMTLGLILAITGWLELRRRAPSPPNAAVLKGASPFESTEGEFFLELDREQDISRLVNWILGDQQAVILLYGPPAVGKTSLVNAGLRKKLSDRNSDLQFHYLQGIERLPIFTAEARKQVVVIDHADAMAEEERGNLVDILRQAIAEIVIQRVFIVILDEDQYTARWENEDFGPRSNVALKSERLDRLTVREAKAVAATLKHKAQIAGSDETVEELVDDLALDERFGLEERKVSPLSLSVALEALAERTFPRAGRGHVSGIRLLADSLIESVAVNSHQDWRGFLLPIVASLDDSRELDIEDLESRGYTELGAQLLLLLKKRSFQELRVFRQVKGSSNRFRVLEEWLPALKLLAESSDFEPEGGLTDRVRTKYVAWRERQRIDKERIAWRLLREGAFLLTRREIRKIDHLQPPRVFDDSRFLYFLRRSRSYRAARTLVFLALLMILTPALYRSYKAYNERIARIKNDALLQGSGIPVDIVLYAQDISTLRVGCGVPHLRWVPEGVVDLSANCRQIRDLEGVPPGVTRLNLSLTSIQGVEGVPKGIEHLDISLTPIRQLPPLDFHKLQRLSVGAIPVEDLQVIPRSVTNLTIGNLKSRSLEGLPPGLTSLTLTGSQSESPIDSLKGLPQDVETLKLYKAVKQIDSLPPKLRELETDVLPIDGVYPPSLKKLTVLEGHLSKVPEQVVELELRQASFEGDLPRGLKVLRVSGSVNIGLSQLPPGLLTLGMPWSEGLRFDALPESLKTLEIDFPEGVISFGGLRATVKALSVTGGKLNSLREIPPSVKKFRCRSCMLRETEEIPSHVRFLALEGCSNIVTIRTLPAGLEELNVRDTPISSLGKLPASLKKLDISDTNLSSLPELPEGLVELTITNGQVQSLKGLPTSVRVLSMLAPRAPGLAFP